MPRLIYLYFGYNVVAKSRDPLRTVSLARATESQIIQIAITPEDRTLVMFPICYLIGFGSQILPFHKSRRDLRPDASLRAALALEAIQTYQPTKTYGFPKLYNVSGELP